MKNALIVRGGWDGHEPIPVSEILGKALNEHGFKVHTKETLDAFKDESLMQDVDLIVPIWTMGAIEREQLTPLLDAVRGGAGIAGVHGGMGDAFRNETEYQFMVGGQWVAHPGGDGVHFTVHIDGKPHPITSGIEDFEVVSEHYYMHVDPANRVLATSRFGDAVMPDVWTKTYGEGRVFYCSMGHSAKVVAMPQVLTIVTRGMLWAAHALEGDE